MGECLGPQRLARRRGQRGGHREERAENDDSISLPRGVPRRGQRLRDAAFVAGQAVREGDRPMGPAAPELKDDSSRR